MVKIGTVETRGNHSYSIETTRDKLGKIEVSDRPNGQIIIEGRLGPLVEIELIEGILLQISGQYGVFRIDLTSDEIRKVFNSCKE